MISSSITLDLNELGGLLHVARNTSKRQPFKIDRKQPGLLRMSDHLPGTDPIREESAVLRGIQQMAVKSEPISNSIYGIS